MNDFTTDFDLEFRKVASEHPYPEGLKDKMRREYPNIKPMVIQGKPLDQVFYTCAEVVKNDMPRLKLTHQEDAEGRIEGVYTSLYMRKKEDITILAARGSSDDEVTVNMRARGHSSGAMDGNVRIMDFFHALQEELAL